MDYEFKTPDGLLRVSPAAAEHPEGQNIIRKHLKCDQVEVQQRIAREVRRCERAITRKRK